MLVNFQPRRLQQARHLRKMSLADLGEAVDITRQSLSQFERGERKPLPENVAKMAMALGMPVEFFLRPIGNLEGSSRTVVHYRSLKNTREIIREQQRASAILDLCAATIDSLQEHVEYGPANVPSIPSGTDALKLSGDEIEEIASEARKKIGLGDGPISDIALLIENLSIPVIHTSLPDGMDGMSVWYGERPIIVVSSDVSYARGRANLAHEFGHLVLHREISEDAELDEETFKVVEPQAWRFAGAFMLPAKTFLSELYSVSLDALVILKRKWGMSVASMVHRLRDLCVISDEQYKHLNIQIRMRKWHKVEPGDDAAREKARLLHRTAKFLEESGSIPIHELVSETRLPRHFIADVLEVSMDELLPPPPRNVVQFKLRGAG